MSKKNFIVTGGYGFIGSCLIKELLKDKNISVCNIDKLSYSSSEESINELDYKNYSFERIDITETQKIKKIIQECSLDQNLKVIGWRDVPVDSKKIGKLSKEVMPNIIQVFIGDEENKDIDNF